MNLYSLFSLESVLLVRYRITTFCTSLRFCPLYDNAQIPSFLTPRDVNINIVYQRLLPLNGTARCVIIHNFPTVLYHVVAKNI